MAITLSKTSFKWGDSPITANNPGAYSVPTWEVDNGLITGQFTNSVTVYPENETGLSTLNVYSSQYFGAATLESGVTFSSNDVSKATANLGAAHFADATLYVVDQTVIHWLEGTIGSDVNPKEIGFASSILGTYECMWQVVDGTTAKIWINGITANSLAVSDQDRLKIKVLNGEEASFYINDTLVLKTGLYPRLTSAKPLIRVSDGGTVYDATYYANASPRDSALFNSTAVLPIQPNYPYDVSWDDGTLIDFAEDKTSIALKRDKKTIYTFNFNNRPKSEFLVLKEFWEAHGIDKTFFFDDLVLEESTLVKFDNVRYTTVKNSVFNIVSSLRQADSVVHPYIAPDTAINLSLTATVTAPAAYDANHPATSAQNGFRHTQGSYTSAGASYTSAADPNTTPQWVEMDFGSIKTVVGVNVFGLSDSTNYSSDPDVSEVSTSFTLIDYVIEAWNAGGANWTNVVTVSGNTKTRRDHVFSDVSTSKMRIYCTNSAAANMHVVEFEVMGN